MPTDGTTGTNASMARLYLMDVPGNICPLGTYCPTGSSQPVQCEDGAYMNVTGASTCLSCPAGSYCTYPFIDPSPCSAGHYCPEGTGMYQLACPVGTFSADLGLQNVNGCTECPGGQFCASTGLTAPSGMRLSLDNDL